MWLTFQTLANIPAGLARLYKCAAECGACANACAVIANNMTNVMKRGMKAPGAQ